MSTAAASLPSIQSPSSSVPHHSLRATTPSSLTPLSRRFSRMPSTTLSSPSVAVTLAASRNLRQRMLRNPVPAPSSRTVFPATSDGWASRYVARCSAPSQVR